MKRNAVVIMGTGDDLFTIRPREAVRPGKRTGAGMPGTAASMEAGMEEF